MLQEVIELINVLVKKIEVN